MKRRISILTSLAAAVLMTASCISTTEFHAIPDSKTPMTMTPALFTNVPEGLAEELGVENGIPSSMCAFLVKKNGKNILFDSGNGGDDAQLIPTLAIHGVAPEDIDYVFITHLHGDHIGGMVKDGKAVFTNATVYLNKDEYDGWGDVDESPMGVAYGKKITLFTDSDVLPCGVQAIKAYGHTPGHQSLLLILDNGTQICCAADALYMDCALDNESEQRFTSPEAIDCLRKMRDAGVHIISGHDPVSFENNQNYFNRC